MSHSSPSLSPSEAPSASRIVVGIDPGLDKHGVVALCAASCRAMDRRMVENTIAGMQELAQRLRAWKSQSGGVLTIALEEAGNYGEALEHFLSQEGFAPVVVSELKVARFKEVLRADANDLIDAEAIARLVIVQPDLGRSPAREAVRADVHGSQHQQLRQLARRHTRWTRDRTAVCNELHAILRRAWLADYQRFFSQIHGAAALAVWQKYPTPVEAAQADPQEIGEVIHHAAHSSIPKEIREQTARDIHTTGRLMVIALGRQDPQRWTAWAEDIRMLARHLVHLNAALRETQRRMEEILKSIDSPLLSFKGMGPVTAAAIHGETLSIGRFASADRFARYNGTAPREDSSGRQPRFVKNRRCNKRLRQAFMQLTLNAIKHQPASKAYQERIAQRGITGQAARVRLARRLSDVVYAMLRDRRAYDPECYMTRKQDAA